MTVEKDYIILSESNFKKRVRLCIDVIFNSEGIEADKTLPILISNRMTRTEGQFEYSWKNRYNNGVREKHSYKATCLKFTSDVLNGTYTVEYLDDLICHEIIHYLLFAKGNYKESHGSIFKLYCRKYNCRLNGCSSVPSYSNKESNNQGCAKVAHTKSKYTIYCDCGFSTGISRASNATKNISAYRCPKCKGKLNVKQNF